MRKNFKLLTAFISCLLFLISLLPSISAKAATTDNSKLLVGYWHNFDNGTGIIKLRDVSTKFDVITVAFGETAGDRCTLEFTPCYGTDADFKADVAYLKSQGKKVVLSIGGQNGVVLVPDKTSKDKFINSTIALIDKYGFDGIDIDLESGISLNGGDTDFKNPTTPQLVNLIDAIRTIRNHYGNGFVLTMAPETAYVQGGLTAYGNIWGAYLPIIYNLRDILTFIHVQHYNTGGLTCLDGANYQPGTADFHVAMTEMLLQGFPVNNNPNNMFPALREDQVMIGIPACPSAAPSGGYTNPTEMKKALDYIIYGKSYGGKYQLRKASGYPGFKGLMTWSINWDAKSNFEFSNSYRDYFGGIVPPVNTLKAATISATTPSKGNFTLNASVPSYNTATSYKILEGSSVISSGTLKAGESTTQNISFNVTNKNPGTYTYTIQLADTSSILNSNILSVVVPDDSIVPTLKAATLSSSSLTSNNFTLTAKIPANNSAITYKFLEGTTEISTGKLPANSSTETIISLDIKNKAIGIYNYTVVLVDSTNKTITSNTITVKIDSQPTSTWTAYTTYKTGEIVSFNNKNYKCIQGHLSLPGWEPSNVPALWSQI